MPKLGTLGSVRGAVGNGRSYRDKEYNVAEAEAVDIVEGNMLRTDMRGATALPWSETPLRMNGTRRNLGDLISPNPLWWIWATTESRGDETVAEEVRSWTAA